MANAPALIAEEKGYFRDEGLNVELKGFGDGPVIQQAVAGGEIDVAYIGAPPVYQWAARGLEAKIIAKVMESLVFRRIERRYEGWRGQ
ncbi:ABC transporter substrate-binding protein [Rhizobium laguerreae]|uniref:ABC transporter substrate-binding protein n=1 Tax=Rhizobium laguerreae TaxID=1076926 RepID=UPI001FEB1E35|nr:ABC transporter substrate-binding protein [Rhizobium laguerreae]